MPSGTPLYTTKVAIRHNKIGEIGLSYMGGIYNKWQDDGLVIDEKRAIHVFALDFNTTLPKSNTFITSEWAWVNVDVPKTYSEQFGNKQFGGFLDIVQPVVKRTIAGWKDAVINIAVRMEYVDWNKGQFIDTGSNIGDHLWSIMPAVSFRPNSQSVLRLNYRIQKQTDVLGNPPSNTAGFNFGLSTYF